MKIPVTCNTAKRGCCGADAAYVCSQLNLPHYYVDVTEPFQELIIKPFRQAYANAQTPNPCIDCNTLLKFSLLWDFLKQNFGITYLATGHYARVTKNDSRAYLGRAKDKTKDQSYFLYGITQERLKNLVLPLGDLTKEKVRAIAADIEIGVAEKSESMELCFAGQGNYRDALADTQADQPGDITDMQGNKIGEHKGIANYTLGQRKGIGFAGGKPLYVGKIDAKKNTIALGTRDQVSCRTIKAEKINVLMPEELVGDNKMYGKIRSYGDPKPCRLININETDITVEFDQPQFAPCPGQRLVLYNCEDNIIAGAAICQQTL
jgi:tRNA-specific 2-thiouridylase